MALLSVPIVVEAGQDAVLKFNLGSRVTGNSVSRPVAVQANVHAPEAE